MLIWQGIHERLEELQYRECYFAGCLFSFGATGLKIVFVVDGPMG